MNTINFLFSMLKKDKKDTWMKTQHRKHRYQVGDEITAKLFDWTPNRVHCSTTIDAKIVACIDAPFGYDIQLSKPMKFQGVVPLPFSSLWLDLPSNQDYLVLDTIFVKEFMISAPSSQLRQHLRMLFDRLVFRKSGVVHTKPVDEIVYINYHKPNGVVETIEDDSKLLRQAKTIQDQIDVRRRLEYRVQHFFGFSKPPTHDFTENSDTAGKQLHFTMNRSSSIDFWDMKWGSFNKTTATRPEEGALICGVASQLKPGLAPSFDRWFICSEQFMNLCLLLKSDKSPPGFESLSEDEIIQKLIIPKNETNHFISHEQPLSSYLYAAIFLLAVREKTDLPVDWELPKRKAEDSPRMESFETWWPQKVLEISEPI